MAIERPTNKIFDVLSKIDVTDKIEEKDGFKYLSWAYAWGELKKHYPSATYHVKRDSNGLPYVYDPNTGYMVFTSVTIGDATLDMSLPVMDNKHKAMKDKPYTYKTKFGDKTVEAATMFDINTAIMRCLVKNIAMFGLGLYIFAGEDLPFDFENELETKKETPQKPVETAKAKPATKTPPVQTEQPPQTPPPNRPATETSESWRKLLGKMIRLLKTNAVESKALAARFGFKPTDTEAIEPMLSLTDEKFIEIMTESKEPKIVNNEELENPLC